MPALSSSLIKISHLSVQKHTDRCIANLLYVFLFLIYVFIFGYVPWSTNQEYKGASNPLFLWKKFFS